MFTRSASLLFCLRAAVLRAAALGLVALTTATAAPITPDPLTPAEREWLAAHPRIVIGASEDWAAAVKRDARGGLYGASVEYIELMNAKLGTDIRLEAGPWYEMVRKAEVGEIDGLTLTSPLEERKKFFLFTDVFHRSHDFIYLRTDDLQKPGAPVDLAGLRGKRVGYIKSTLRIGRALAQYPTIVPVVFDNYGALADALLRGEIDAAIASYSLEYWRGSKGVVGMAITRIVHEIDPSMVMSIDKNKPELVGILNKGIAAITRAEMEALYRRWFGPDYVDRVAAAGVRLSAEERAWLSSHPVVRVGYDPRWAPVEFADASGTARGMSIAYLERLGKMLGVRFEPVAGPSWSEALRRLHDKQVDLLPALVPTEPRRATMAFTEPYLSFPAAIFSAAGVAYLGGLESLRGRTVAVVQDEAIAPWLRANWPALPLLPVADTPAGLSAVAEGRAYAFVGNLVTTSYYIGQSGLTHIKVAGETPFSYQLAMGVRGDWPLLAGILQKGLDAISSAERDEIYHEWIAIRYEHGVDYSLLWRVVAGAALLLLAVLGERVWAMRRANRRLRELTRENALVEQRERQRLATELHDSPMQKLALAQLQLGAARRAAGGEAAGSLGVGLDLMREAIDELRTLQFELSPPMLYQEGLAPALRWLAAHASERSAVDFAFRASGSTDEVPQPLAIVLYQCARELVYNAAKHSQARTGAIELDVGGGELRLSVTDDGQGMPAERVPSTDRPGGGFGLASIRERLAVFDGSLALDSGEGGTRATLRVPLARPVPQRAEPMAANA